MLVFGFVVVYSLYAVLALFCFVVEVLVDACWAGRRSAPARFPPFESSACWRLWQCYVWTLPANLTGVQVGVIHWRLVGRGMHANAQIKMGT